MSPALELLVQFVGTITNPVVIAAALAMPFFWSSALAVRLAAMVAGGAFGVMDAVIGSAAFWGFAIVAVSIAGGLVVAQATLLVLLPLAAAALGALRRIKRH